MRYAGALLLFVLLLAGCAGRNRSAGTEGLPLLPEPAYSGVPATEVTAAMEAALQARLKAAPAVAARHFAGTPAARGATYEAKFAQLIRSEAGLLQRAALEATVPAIPQDIHDPCTQRVLLWFTPEGGLVGVYVREPRCPI